MTATRTGALPRSPRTPTAKTKLNGAVTEPDGAPPSTAGNSLSGKSTPQGALSPSLFDSLQQRASKLKVLLGSLQVSSGGRAPGTGQAEASAATGASGVGSNAGHATSSSGSTKPGAQKLASAPAKAALGSKLDSAAHHPAPAIAATITGGANRARAGSWSSGARGADTGAAGQRAQGVTQSKAPGKHKDAVSPSMILKSESRTSCAEGAQAAPRPPQQRASPAAPPQVITREAVKQRRSASDGGAAAPVPSGSLDRRSPAGILLTPAPAGGAAGVGGRMGGEVSAAGAGSRPGVASRSIVAAATSVSTSVAAQPAPHRSQPSYAALAHVAKRGSSGGSSGCADQHQRSAHAPPLPPPPPLPAQPAKARSSRSPSPSPPGSSRWGTSEAGSDAGGSALPQPPPPRPPSISQAAGTRSDSITAPAAPPPVPTLHIASRRSDGGAQAAEAMQTALPPDYLPVNTALAHHRPRSQAAEELSAILSSLASVSVPSMSVPIQPLDESPPMNVGPDLMVPFGAAGRTAAPGEDGAAPSDTTTIPHALRGYGHDGLMMCRLSGGPLAGAGATGADDQGLSTAGTVATAAPADSEAALAQALAVARASALAAFMRPTARVYRARAGGFKTTRSGSSSPTAHGAAGGGGSGPGQSHVFVGVPASAAPFACSGLDVVAGSPRCGGTSSGVESARSPCVLSPSARSSRYEKLLMLQEAGNGARPRSSSAGAPGPDFMRRNAILLKKRQAWAATKRKDSIGSPSSNRQQSQVRRLRAAWAAEDDTSEPPAVRRRVSSGGPSGRSLLDLQRWADRREKRLAVLREEREAEERARANAQLTFKPAIGERSRRLAKMARSRPSYVPLPGCSPPPRSPTPPPGAAAGLGRGAAAGRAASAGPSRPSANTGGARLQRSSTSAARVRPLGTGRNSVGGTSVASTLGITSSPARSPADLMKATRGSRPGQQAGVMDPGMEATAGGSVKASVGGAMAAVAGGGGAGFNRVGSRASKGSSVATQLAAARNSRARGRYASASGIYDDPVVGSVADAIKSATAALKLRPAQSRRTAPTAQSLPSQSQQSTDAELARVRPRARQRPLLSQSTQSLQQQLPMGRGVRVSVAGSAALSSMLGAGSPRRRRRGTSITGAGGAARTGHEDPHSVQQQQQRRQSAPFAGLGLWESPQPHSPHAYAHGGSRRPSLPPSPLPGGGMGLHGPALGSTRSAASPRPPPPPADAAGVGDLPPSSPERTPDSAGRVARRTIELLGSGGAGGASAVGGSGGLAVRTGRSPVLLNGSVSGFGSEVSGSGGAHPSARLRFSLGNDAGSPFAGSPVILMLGYAGGNGATGAPLDAATAAAAATTTVVGPNGMVVQIPQVVRLAAASPDSAHDSTAAALRLSGVGGGLIAAPAAAGGLAVGAFRYRSLTPSPASSYMTLPYDAGGALLLSASPMGLTTGQGASAAAFGVPSALASGVAHGNGAGAASRAATATVDAPAFPATAPQPSVLTVHHPQPLSAVPAAAVASSGGAAGASDGVPVAAAPFLIASRTANVAGKNQRGSCGGADTGSFRASSARGSHGGAPLPPTARPGPDLRSSQALSASAALDGPAVSRPPAAATADPALTEALGPGYSGVTARAPSRGPSSGGALQPQPQTEGSGVTAADTVTVASAPPLPQAAGPACACADAAQSAAAAIKGSPGFSPPCESTYSLAASFASLRMASPSRPAGGLLRGVRFTKILAQQFAAGLMSCKPSSPTDPAAAAADQAYPSPLTTSMSAPVFTDSSFCAVDGLGSAPGDGAGAGRGGGECSLGSGGRLCVEPRSASAPSGPSGWLQAYREAYGHTGRSGRAGAGSGYPGLRFMPVSFRTGRSGKTGPEGADATADAATDNARAGSSDAWADRASDSHAPEHAAVTATAAAPDSSVEGAAAGPVAGSHRRVAGSEAGSSSGGSGLHPTRPRVVDGAADMVMTIAAAPQNASSGELPGKGSAEVPAESRSGASSDGGSHGVDSEDPLVELQSLIWRMKHLAEDCDAVATYTSSGGGSSIGHGLGRFSSAGGSGSAGIRAGRSSGSAGGGIGGNSSVGGSSAGGSVGGAIKSCTSSSGGKAASSDGGSSTAVNTGYTTAPQNSELAGTAAEAGAVMLPAATDPVVAVDRSTGSAAGAAETAVGHGSQPAGLTDAPGEPAGVSTPRRSSAGSAAPEPAPDTSPAAPLPLEVLVRRAEQLRASLLSSLGSSPVSVSPSGSWAGTASQRASPSPQPGFRPGGGGGVSFSPMLHASAASSARRSGVASVSSGSGASLSPLRSVGAVRASGGGVASASMSGSGASVSSEFFFPRLSTDAAAAAATAAVGIKALPLVPMADWPPPLSCAVGAVAAQPPTGACAPEAEEVVHEISLAGGMEQPPPGARQAPRRAIPPALASAAEELAAAAALQPRYSVWSLADHLPAPMTTTAASNTASAGSGTAAAATAADTGAPIQGRPTLSSRVAMAIGSGEQDLAAGAAEGQDAVPTSTCTVETMLAPGAVVVKSEEGGKSLEALQSLIRQVADL